MAIEAREPDTAGTVAHPHPDERASKGRAARAAVPRSSHEGWDPPASRRSPVEVLQEQAKTRVPELVPIRHARMTASPFAFYRGAAAIMAADLAATPSSGLRVQCCGDAHLANFGGFAAPDRAIVFDINDFDETLPGPWEWDVKRLAASFEIAARSREFDDQSRKRVVLEVVRSYREAMGELAATRNLDLWYQRLDASDISARWSDRLSSSDLKRFERNVAKARTKDSLKAFSKLTAQVDGNVRIVSDPPLVASLDDLMPAADADRARNELHQWFRGYRDSLQPDRRHLLETFELVDFARKVVGVGSVGTRCFIALLLGRDDGDPLFLQIKEAAASVLEPYAGKGEYENHGRRVVEGQRLTQSSSDIFLGWDRAPSADGVLHDFYVRQLWDGKLSPSIDLMTPEALRVFADMCGATLARAHARSGDRIAIAAYLGSGDVFDRAILTFAGLYADQNRRDFDTVVAAIRDGVLQADAGELAAR